MKTTPIIIITQGFPELSNATEAWVNYEYPDIVLVSFDMRTKWCEITSSFSSKTEIGIVIDATDRATQIVYGRDICDYDTWTQIIFPEFKEWDIAMCECRRYTVQLLFTKRK